jgi:hypothetical protein
MDEWMEAIMAGITSAAFGALVAIATTVASASFIGTAAAQDLVIKRFTPPVYETGFRLSDQQRLRNYYIVK